MNGKGGQLYISPVTEDMESNFGNDKNDSEIEVAFKLQTGERIGGTVKSADFWEFKNGEIEELQIEPDEQSNGYLIANGLDKGIMKVKRK